MARVDLRTIKRTVGRDGNVRLPGTLIAIEEWSRWHNWQAYLDQREVEMLIDGKTLDELVNEAHAKATKAPTVSNVKTPGPSLPEYELPSDIEPPKKTTKKAG